MESRPSPIVVEVTTVSKAVDVLEFHPLSVGVGSGVGVLGGKGVMQSSSSDVNMCTIEENVSGSM